MAREPWKLGTVLLLTSLAACVDEQREDPPISETSAPVPHLIAIANNATACTRVFPAIFVDRAHAQTFLPTGFRAAEASRFFGQEGQSSGRGVMVVSGMRCEGSEWSAGKYVEAMAGIFVEAPVSDGQPAEGEHFYELARVVPGSAAQSLTLRDLRWTIIGDGVDVSQSASSARAATLTVRNGSATVFDASVPVAGVHDDFSGTFHIRWWHETDIGLGVHEYVFRPDGYLGLGTCEAAAGSVIAAIRESTTCEALFMVGPPFDVEGRFEFERSGD